MTFSFSARRRFSTTMNSSLRPSLGSLAAMAALTLPAASPAQVVMSALENVGFANGSSITLDIDGDLTNDFSLFANSSHASITRIGATNGIFWNGSSVDVFSNGSTIGPVFANEAASVDFDMLTGSSGYVGVYFKRGDNTHAAWLHFDFSSGDP